MMNYSFLPEAEKELYEQALYYNEQELGLGNEFLDEVEFAITRILETPYSWTEIEKGIRRILTRRFPFGVLYHYIEEQSEILIIAVMNTNREPGYWQSRKF